MFSSFIYFFSTKFCCIKLICKNGHHAHWGNGYRNKLKLKLKDINIWACDATCSHFYFNCNIFYYTTILLFGNIKAALKQYAL